MHGPCRLPRWWQTHLKKLPVAYRKQQFDGLGILSRATHTPPPPINPHLQPALPGENAPFSLRLQPSVHMALNSTRSAWSIATQSLRPLLQPCSSSSASSSSSFAISSVSATAAVSCRHARYHDLARTPTALREQDDPLNKPATEADLEEARPRWAYTPEAMKGRHGFSLNYIRKPSRAIWHVNEDPVLLDSFYERFLGRNGARMLPDDLKWLAVTHKSFDYGRRGFNTRLAFFGKIWVWSWRVGSGGSSLC